MDSRGTLDLRVPAAAVTGLLEGANRTEVVDLHIRCDRCDWSQIEQRPSAAANKLGPDTTAPGGTIHYHSDHGLLRFYLEANVTNWPTAFVLSNKHVNARIIQLSLEPRLVVLPRDRVGMERRGPDLGCIPPHPE